MAPVQPAAAQPAVASQPVVVELMQKGSDHSASTAEDLKVEKSPHSLDDMYYEIPHHAPSRNATWVGATAHVITAVIGAGVLSLPFSMAVLGWVGGPIMILVFAYVTLKTSVLLADCYFVHGKRQRTYRDMVESVFGRTGGIILALVQYSNLWLTAVAYNITGAVSMQNIAYRACQINGQDPDSCSMPRFWVFCAIFGGAEVILSQLPNMDSTVWSSAVGALTSFAYCLITIGLSIGKVAEGNHHGDVQGMPGELIYPQVTDVPLAKTMGIFNSFGTIVFSFSFSMILIEITDTIKKGPNGSRHSSRLVRQQGAGAPTGALASSTTTKGARDSAKRRDGEYRGSGAGAVVDEAEGGAAVLDDRDRYEVLQMRKAVNASLFWITFFFLLISVLGYLSFGNDSCGNILSCFESPAWLIIIANALVLIHVLSAYQVYSQPVFYFCEDWIHNSRIPISCHNPWPARITFRVLYAVTSCIIAIALPFFWDFVSLVGALGFWPTTVIFPIACFIKVYQPGKRYRYFLHAINVISLILTICATAGAIYGIVLNAKSYHIFGD